MEAVQNPDLATQFINHQEARCLTMPLLRRKDVDASLLLKTLLHCPRRGVGHQSPTSHLLRMELPQQSEDVADLQRRLQPNQRLREQARGEEGQRRKRRPKRNLKTMTKTRKMEMNKYNNTHQ